MLYKSEKKEYIKIFSFCRKYIIFVCRIFHAVRYVLLLPNFPKIMNAPYQHSKWFMRSLYYSRKQYLVKSYFLINLCNEYLEIYVGLQGSLSLDQCKHIE